jgi:antiviral helicase SKI2
VFSRKKLEQCAHEVGTNLLEFDSKIPYTVDRECEQLLRERLPNFEEYLHLPEYVNLVALLRKGIAIHHAGLMPVLKEMVELLFARGFVKLL